MIKRILLSIIFTSLFIGCKTASEKMPKVNPKLMNGQYSFTGTVNTVMGEHKCIHQFKGKTSLKTFECTWVQDMGHMKMTGSVNTDGDFGVLKVKGMKEQKSNAIMAIAGATGISGGSAHLMYALWKGNNSGIFPSENVKIIKRQDLTIITGTSHGQWSQTITMKEGNIVSVESVFDPAENKLIDRPKLTDEQIIETLKATNKEVTPKAIADMREILLEANEVVSEIKDKITTRTVFTIID